MKPLAIELFAGRFGWGKGFVGEGFRVVGFDILHESYHGPVPEGCELVLQDVLTLHGSQFKDAACIVASPPCQQYSLWGMRMFHPNPPLPDKQPWDAAIRIAKEAGLPLVVENVRGSQYFWGKSDWREGPFHLWFYNVPPMPALVPYIPRKRKNVVDDVKNGDRRGLAVNNQFSSNPEGRKRLSAESAEIPIEMARWIAQCFKP